ncbi:hypothetical protein PBCVNEJV1_060L [Paramecium bursaria Chlorella virus NE-JV-1]|nr:hypothetical protein PBCVNEJV1_060L [Paramecium bursaria Chlorella virus NE-JV-1]
MSIKSFFAEHNAILAANIPRKPEKSLKKHYHVDVESPEAIEAPKIANTSKMSIKSFFTDHNGIWAKKIDAAKASAPPVGFKTKYMLDQEMDAFNLWSPWAAKSKPLPPMTEREIENLKNKSWTVERRA